MGAVLHRLLHWLLYSWHVGLLYVDDWLWRFQRHVAPLQATMLALFLCAIGCLAAAEQRHQAAPQRAHVSLGRQKAPASPVARLVLRVE